MATGGKGGAARVDLKMALWIAGRHADHEQGKARGGRGAARRVGCGVVVVVVVVREIVWGGG